MFIEKHQLKKLLQSIIFLNIFICAEELNYIKYYLKVRCEAWGREPFSQFVLSAPKYEISAKKRASKHNLRQNICRLFQVLAQCLFLSSETELGYYHQKVNVRLTGCQARYWIKVLDQRKLGNFKKIPEIPKKQLVTFALKSFAQDYRTVH